MSLHASRRTEQLQILILTVTELQISFVYVQMYSCCYFDNAEQCTKAVWKVRGLVLLLRVGILWRCGDGLSFQVPPLASDALLTTLHPLLENVL
jgi:hypothetical protein